MIKRKRPGFLSALLMAAFAVLLVFSACGTTKKAVVQKEKPKEAAAPAPAEPPKEDPREPAAAAAPDQSDREVPVPEESAFAQKSPGVKPPEMVAVPWLPPSSGPKPAPAAPRGEQRPEYSARSPLSPEVEALTPGLPVTAASSWTLPLKSLTPEAPPSDPFFTLPLQDAPPIPDMIMSRGSIKAPKLASFLRAYNPLVNASFADELSQIYIEEAEMEGVNWDIAFAQMCLETGFLRYGNLVTKEMNNFCGLGALGPNHRGEAFPDTRTGVRAHIQHLKAYASPDPLNLSLVDPRRRFVKLGTGPSIETMASFWAADKDYGKKIRGLLTKMYIFNMN
ncbi:MAG: glucosaminidase domain-containing protein [Treponema sp.]|jgi:hypothetical protein|nr:glucosaminidase domain-containing protein [Treponema sp.]